MPPFGCVLEMIKLGESLWQTQEGLHLLPVLGVPEVSPRATGGSLGEKDMRCSGCHILLAARRWMGHASLVKLYIVDDWH